MGTSINLRGWGSEARLAACTIKLTWEGGAVPELRRQALKQPKLKIYRTGLIHSVTPSHGTNHCAEGTIKASVCNHSLRAGTDFQLGTELPERQKKDRIYHFVVVIFKKKADKTGIRTQAPFETANRPSSNRT